MVFYKDTFQALYFFFYFFIIFLFIYGKSKPILFADETTVWGTQKFCISDLVSNIFLSFCVVNLVLCLGRAFNFLLWAQKSLKPTLHYDIEIETPPHK